jgi:hypothetical protein
MGPSAGETIAKKFSGVVDPAVCQFGQDFFVFLTGRGETSKHEGDFPTQHFMRLWHNTADENWLRFIMAKRRLHVFSYEPDVREAIHPCVSFRAQREIFLVS